MEGRDGWQQSQAAGGGTGQLDRGGWLDQCEERRPEAERSRWQWQSQGEGHGATEAGQGPSGGCRARKVATTGGGWVGLQGPGPTAVGWSWRAWADLPCGLAERLSPPPAHGLLMHCSSTFSRTLLSPSWASWSVRLWLWLPASGQAAFLQGEPCLELSGCVSASCVAPGWLVHLLV